MNACIHRETGRKGQGDDDLGEPSPPLTPLSQPHDKLTCSSSKMKDTGEEMVGGGPLPEGQKRLSGHSGSGKFN